MSRLALTLAALLASAAPAAAELLGTCDEIQTKFSAAYSSWRDLAAEAESLRRMGSGYIPAAIVAVVQPVEEDALRSLQTALRMRRALDFACEHPSKMRLQTLVHLRDLKEQIP